ncbi:hypothetical protein EXE49_16985 [Halorubrum sp. ASP121]|uniref:hypothetical protein n=1 Tax=Halorubrum sp. ASP121 TaxID=1855858 RepID=UPI0010F6DFA6|nr:hypothetical protein [Halorubrum sp. ASP121]TKX47795.1 hypothetical protein EXE49_16985 [Halorubrum sp. ASP121]
MLTKTVLGAFVLNVAIGILIGTIKPDYLSSFTVAIGLLIALPIVLVIKSVKLVIWLVVSLWTLLLNLGYLIGKSLIKSLVVIVVGVVQGSITVVTTPIKYLGQGAETVVQLVKKLEFNPGIFSNIISAREMMIDIIVDVDDIESKLEKEGEYRDEFIRVKESGKNKLSFGEYTLSLSIGILLIITQALSIQPFGTTIRGIPFSLGIEVGLVLIAVSITYRIMIIEHLCYSGDEKFDSLEKMDVALSYQKSIANVGIAQFLSFLVYFGMYISDVDTNVLKPILKRYYRDDDYIDAMRFAIEQIKRR